MTKSRAVLGGIFIAIAVFFSPSASAQGGDPNVCDVPGEYPDIIIGAVTDVQRYGSVDGMGSFSFETTSCNIGTCWAEWFRDDDRHPVITQSLYRIKDGRFEMVGTGWLKHGFSTLSEDLCSSECVEVADFQHLGVNCSDPYDSFLNGVAEIMGPRWEVNAWTGRFPFPHDRRGEPAIDTLDRRLQVADIDINPADNPFPARYLVESQYVAKDDAIAGRGMNNVSSRQAFTFSDPAGPGFDTALSVFEGQAAIERWPNLAPDVTVVPVQIPGEGKLHVGVSTTDNGDGTWRYSYAVHNFNSHRSVGLFEVPVPDSGMVTGIGQGHPRYHSGELQEPTPWDVVTFPKRIVWETEAYDVNGTANAVRWGSVHNFELVSNAPPGPSEIKLGLWAPGTPDSVIAYLPGPSVCNNDGQCQLIESLRDLPRLRGRRRLLRRRGLRPWRGSLQLFGGLRDAARLRRSLQRRDRRRLRRVRRLPRYPVLRRRQLQRHPGRRQ